MTRAVRFAALLLAFPGRDGDQIGYGPKVRMEAVEQSHHTKIGRRSTCT
jgi:hypothetical protein